LARKAAEVCGASSFRILDTLHFTFHVEAGDTVRSRAWSWLISADSVAYAGRNPAGRDTAIQYSRKSPADSLQRQVDHWFINDQYWLLFPCHLAWDPGLKLSADSVRDSSGANLFRLTATYPDQGGYTPGDTYELFLDPSGVVRGWIYRKGGAAPGKAATRWSSPEPVGPLRLSLYRKGLEGKFNVWFTDVRAVPKPRR
jgi:hypothetical protein